MTENKTPKTTTEPAEFDFDAWLSGAKRAARYVPLYADGEALAQLSRVNDAISKAQTLKDRGLNEDDPKAALVAERDRLRTVVEASKIEVRVEASIEDEQAALLKQVHADMADKRAEVEKTSRADAEATAKSMDFDADERRDYIRKHVAAQVDRVDSIEGTLRILADRVQVKRGGAWTPIGRDALDSLRARLGDAQVLELQNAWAEATNETPDSLSVPSSPVR